MEDSSQARLDLTVFSCGPGSPDLRFTIQESDNQDIPTWRDFGEPIVVSQPGLHRKTTPRPTRPMLRVLCNTSCSARVALHLVKVDGELKTFFE